MCKTKKSIKESCVRLKNVTKSDRVCAWDRDKLIEDKP